LIRFWANNNGSVTKSKDLLSGPELLQQPSIHIRNALVRGCREVMTEGHSRDRRKPGADNNVHPSELHAPQVAGVDRAAAHGNNSVSVRRYVLVKASMPTSGADILLKSL